MEGRRRKRLVGLDLFRIICAVMVFLFHSAIHIGCTYSILHPFIGMGAIFMTGFFMLSGFVLHYIYGKRKLWEFDELKNYYKKRWIDTIVLYWIFGLLYLAFLSKETLLENLLLFPIELFGIQTYFCSLFSTSHNDGTWFISCLILCYMVFPLMALAAGQLRKRELFMTGVFLAGLLSYIPVAVRAFGLHSIYSNPLIRCVEFFLGVLLCELWLQSSDGLKEKFSSWPFILGEWLALMLLVTCGVRLNIQVGNYMYYNLISEPLFLMIIFSMAGRSIRCLEEKRPGGDILQYASGLCYAFFLAQFFTWNTTRKVLGFIGTDANGIKIIISFSVCVCIAVLLHEGLEKPVKKRILKNRE